MKFIKIQRFFSLRLLIIIIFSSKNFIKIVLKEHNSNMVNNNKVTQIFKINIKVNIIKLKVIKLKIIKP